MKNALVSKILPAIAAVTMLLTPAAKAVPGNIAVWLDGSLTDGGNGIPTRIASMGFTVTLVTSAQLATPGFLSSFDAIVVSRNGASFGTFLSGAAAANVSAYVGSGASQGGVAVFTNDMADNLGPSGHGGDPFDPNLDALFVNAVTFAAASHHGYVGEFNGAVMAMTANTAGATPLGLLTGSAGTLRGFGPDFTYGVGPIGAGNPIDAGVTFPFTDADHSTFLTDITGADPTNIVDIYTNAAINGEPAVLANGFVINGGNPPGLTPVPEPSTYGICASLLLAGAAGYRRIKRRFNVAA